MSNLDNDDLYRDDETTGATAPLAEHDDEETLEEAYEPTSSSPRPAGNKVFIIALGILAAVFILSIVGMIIFASISLPRQQQAQTQTAFAISMGNDATITAATATQEALILSQEQTEAALNATATEIPPTATEAKPTATEKVVQPTEEEAEAEVMGGEELAAEADPALTATTGALLTLVAQQATETAAAEQAVTPNAAQMTATAQAELNAAAAAAELPDTGFLDGGGLYATAGAALVLVLIILVVRKLRKG